MGYAVAAALATERPSRWSREIRPLDAGRWLSGLCRRVLPITADMPSEPSSPPNTRAPLSVKAGQAHGSALSARLAARPAARHRE